MSKNAKSFNKSKKKKKIKKIKSNNDNDVFVNFEFVENLDKNFFCLVIIDVFVLLNVFYFNDYHYYIDFEIERYFNDHKNIILIFIKLNYFVTIINFNNKNIMSYQNTLKIKISIYDKSQIIMIRDILYVLDFSFNLHSIKVFERKNLRIVFDEKNCQIIRKNSQ